MGVMRCVSDHIQIFLFSLPSSTNFQYTPPQTAAAAAAAATLLRAPTNTVCTLPLGLCNSFVNLLDTDIHVG